MDIDSIIDCKKTEDTYVDILKDVFSKILSQDSILQIMNLDKLFLKRKSKNLSIN